MAKTADKMILFTYFINNKCIDVATRKSTDMGLTELSVLSDETYLWLTLYWDVCTEIYFNITNTKDKHIFEHSVINFIPCWLNRTATAQEKQSYEYSIQSVNALTQPSVVILTNFIDVIMKDTTSPVTNLSMKNLLCKKILGLTFLYWKTKPHAEISHLTKRMDDLFIELYTKHTVKRNNQVYIYTPQRYLCTYLFNLFECAKSSIEMDAISKLILEINQDMTRNRQLEPPKSVEEAKVFSPIPISKPEISKNIQEVSPKISQSIEQAKLPSPKVEVSITISSPDIQKSAQPVKGIQYTSVSKSATPASTPSNVEMWTAFLKNKYTRDDLVKLCIKHKISYKTGYTKAELCTGLIANFGDQAINL